MISKADLTSIINELGQQAVDDIQWAEELRPPTDAADFASEAIFVICNSGMKNTVARGIFDRCMLALLAERPVFDVFKHPGKAAAIETIWRDRMQLLAGYLAVDDKLAFCESLPWIGAVV